MKKTKLEIAQATNSLISVFKDEELKGPDRTTLVNVLGLLKDEFKYADTDIKCEFVEGGKHTPEKAEEVMKAIEILKKSGLTSVVLHLQF